MNQIALLFAALIATASWVTPNHSLPWLSFHAEFMMALALAIGLWGEFLRRPLLGASIAPLTVATLGIAAVPLIQVATGLIRFAGDGWMVFAYLLAFAFAQILGQRLVTRWGQTAIAESLAGMFLAGALFSVGLQLYQWLRLSGLGIFAVDMPPSGVPFANFAQPNHLATMLFLGLVGLLFLHERQRVRMHVVAMGAAFIEAGMVMTGSRTAWLAMGLLLVSLWLARHRAALRISSASILGFGVLFAALVVAWPLVNDWLLLAPGRSLANQVVAGPRPLFYATMLDAVWQRPWWGYGWNQGLVAQMAVIDDHPAGGRLMGNSHNVVLDLLVWNGWPLACAIVAFLGWWFWRQVRLCRTAIQCFLLMALGGVLVHAMLEYPLSYSYFLLPAGLMMGALDAERPSRSGLWIPRGVLFALFTTGTALLALIVFEYAKVESNTETLRYEVARIGTHSIQSKAPDLVLLTQWQQYLLYARVSPHAGMTRTDLERMRLVMERFPYSSLMRQYAAANALNGRPEVARTTLERLCKLHGPARCRIELLEWRELAQSAYPQLAAVPAPSPVGP